MVVDLIDYDGKFSSWEKFDLSAVDFLEWYGSCTPFLENGKTLEKKSSFGLKSGQTSTFKFHHGVFKRTRLYDIFKVKTFHIHEIFVQKEIKRPAAKENYIGQIQDYGRYMSKNIHYDK